jgi:hypothetical protein
MAGLPKWGIVKAAEMCYSELREIYIQPTRGIKHEDTRIPQLPQALSYQTAAIHLDDYFASVEWSSIIGKWEGYVRDVVERKGNPPQLY